MTSDFIASMTKEANQNDITNFESAVKNIRVLLAPELEALENTIDTLTVSPSPVINSICEYILDGGKQIRPIISLLSAKALGYEGEQHVLFASMIELLHTATLLHDDVIDNSSLRRNKKTANMIWGNAASILTGDFLTIKMMEKLVTLRHEKTDPAHQERVISMFMGTATTLIEGEFIQLNSQENCKYSEKDYMMALYGKTAKLFEAAACCGAGVVNVEEELSDVYFDQFSKYGRDFGMAFQLMDDTLDLVGDADLIGKNLGDDLAEGKATMPLIYVINNGPPEDAAFIKKALKDKSSDHLEEVIHIIKQSSAIDYTLDKAREISEGAINALDFLDDSEYKQALLDLAAYSVIRSA